MHVTPECFIFSSPETSQQKIIHKVSRKPRELTQGQITEIKILSLAKEEVNSLRQCIFHSNHLEIFTLSHNERLSHPVFRHRMYQCLDSGRYVLYAPEQLSFSGLA